MACPIKNILMEFMKSGWRFRAVELSQPEPGIFSTGKGVTVEKTTFIIVFFKKVFVQEYASEAGGGGKMVSRKYADDYRLENVRAKNGRLVTKPVYRGDIFDFGKEEKEVSKTRKIFLVSTVLEWVFVFLFLLLNSGKGRVMYVSLPFIAVAFPLLSQSDIVWMLARRKGEFKREEKDRITERLFSSVFISFFFASCSVIGHIVAWIRYGESTADAIQLVLSVLLVFSSWNLFSKRDALSMKKTGTTVIPETED